MLAESGRANDAVVAATESVEIRRELVQDSGMSVAALTGALHNLSNRYEELGRANEALQLASEIVGLEGRVDATAAAIHRLLVGEVCRRIGSSRFVHFSCHAVATVGDPDSSGLQLGPSDDYQLSIRLLTEYLAARGAPRFVALSACQTGRTETAAPEQATSIASIFLGHGTRCALATLWNVHDAVARGFGIEFVRSWSSGMAAGAAYDATLRSLAAQLTRDLRALETLDAFQLIGDRNLTWDQATTNQPI